MLADSADPLPCPTDDGPTGDGPTGDGPTGDGPDAECTGDGFYGHGLVDALAAVTG
jgi:hypothetical protein